MTVDWQGGDDISIRDSLGQSVPPRQGGHTNVNKADDIALILFTSGPSGPKKVVPITLHSIIAGVSFVIESWGLSSSDICLNMMPLYHV
jgi:long-subunit acyl-CoA synthetase (AMP-forming)